MKRNSKLLISLLSLLGSMLLLSFASVPIYNLFCKATGFAGTIQHADYDRIISKGSKKIKILLDANISKDLMWEFFPKHRDITVITGENTIIFYEAKNLSDVDLIGTAIYNITPLKAGKYFTKIHCFCFEEQFLKANSKILFPVSFYIDPDIEKDKNMDSLSEITLSYSFYKVR
ncbi:MAG: cytochrome c oxidase assembly protein [Rickettsia sp.]|nr:cytochrome c oxidase assembly protein [Rickettsia sp.]